jgi:hypothetical protein
MFVIPSQRRNSPGETLLPGANRLRNAWSPVTSTLFGWSARRAERCSSPSPWLSSPPGTSLTWPFAAMSVRTESIFRGERPCLRRITGRRSTDRYSARRSTDSRNGNRPASMPSRIRAVGPSGSEVKNPLTTTFVSMIAGGEVTAYAGLSSPSWRSGAPPSRRALPGAWPCRRFAPPRSQS